MSITAIFSSALVNIGDLIGAHQKGTQAERTTFLPNHRARSPGSDLHQAFTRRHAADKPSHSSKVESASDDGLPALQTSKWTLSLSRMTLRDWLNFGVVALATFNDYFDLYIVSITIWKLATYYQTTYTNISSAMTFSLLARSAGALMFGAAGSSSSSTLTRRYGQRASLTLTCLAMGGVHIISIHMTTVDAFFFTRGVMGLEIGSMWGSIAHDVVKACPPEAQALLFSALDMISSVAFIAVALINWKIGGRARTWKTLFWIAAGLSFVTAALRLVVPEQHKHSTARSSTTPTASLQDTERLAIGPRVRRYFRRSAASSRRALRLAWTMWRSEWRMMMYMVVFATLQAYAQNILVLTYMAFLRRGKLLPNGRASVVCMVARSGGNAGSVLGAWFAAYLGLRRTLVLFTLFACFLMPAAVLPDATARLCLGGFAMHFALFAALAAMPTYFRAITPHPYTKIMPLVTYHIGSCLASPATQLTHLLTSQFHTHVIMRGHSHVVPAYTTTMLILVSSFCLFWALWTAVGPDESTARTTDESDSIVAATNPHTDVPQIEQQGTFIMPAHEIETPPPQLSPQRAFSPLMQQTLFSSQATDEIIRAPGPVLILEHTRLGSSADMI